MCNKTCPCPPGVVRLADAFPACQHRINNPNGDALMAAAYAAIATHHQRWSVKTLQTSGDLVCVDAILMCAGSHRQSQSWTRCHLNSRPAFPALSALRVVASEKHRAPASSSSELCCAVRRERVRQRTNGDGLSVTFACCHAYSLRATPPWAIAVQTFPVLCPCSARPTLSLSQR